MFSGIVEEVARIAAVTDTADGQRLRLKASKVLEGLKLGDSICCSGCCLTVVAFGADYFEIEAVLHTLRVTKLGALRVGDGVNVERALQVSDRLGGHIVSGHVDGVAEVTSVRQDGFGRVVEFSADAALRPFFIEKGSVTVDGVSLTVAALQPGKPTSSTFTFAVALIPHTLEMTTLQKLQPGSVVNIEADMIGKYVANLISQGYAPAVPAGV